MHCSQGLSQQRPAAKCAGRHAAAPRPWTSARAHTARRHRVHAAKLHIPHEGSSGNPVFDLLMGASMQAQQVTNCYNNCLATSVAIVKAAEAIGAPGYAVVFGHLASTKPGIQSQIPHVWVQWRDQLILDAALSDAMPTEEVFNYKRQLAYVPGPADSPLPNVGLPSEAPEQSKLQYFANHPDEYVELLAAAPEDTSQSRAYLMYISLTQGLGSAKDDLAPLIAQSS